MSRWTTRLSWLCRGRLRRAVGPAGRVRGGALLRRAARGPTRGELARRAMGHGWPSIRQRRGTPSGTTSSATCVRSSPTSGRRWSAGVPWRRHAHSRLAAEFTPAFAAFPSTTSGNAQPTGAPPSSSPTPEPRDSNCCSSQNRRSQRAVGGDLRRRVCPLLSARHPLRPVAPVVGSARAVWPCSSRWSWSCSACSTGPSNQAHGCPR
jgi:hypothetical protein